MNLDDDQEALANANRRLSHRRQHQKLLAIQGARRTAMDAFREAIKRGDMGSPLVPNELMQCGHCDCQLTDRTRSHIIGVCQRCLEELVAREEDYKRRRDAKLAKEASRAGWGAMGTIVPWVLLAMAGAMLLGWLGSNAAWAIGKWWGGA
jgi:hypothetical protein